MLLTFVLIALGIAFFWTGLALIICVATATAGIVAIPILIGVFLFVFFVSLGALALFCHG